MNSRWITSNYIIFDFKFGDQKQVVNRVNRVSREENHCRSGIFRSKKSDAMSHRSFFPSNSIPPSRVWCKFEENPKGNSYPTGQWSFSPENVKHRDRCFGLHIIINENEMGMCFHSARSDWRYVSQISDSLQSLLSFSIFLEAKGLIEIVVSIL